MLNNNHVKYLYPGKPQNYAQDIHSAINLPIPVDIEKICKYFDIKIAYENFENAEALLLVYNGNKNILISDKITYEPRLRFSIAHELGHFSIPWHSNNSPCNNIGKFDINDIDEKEADVFASELLIPTESLQTKLKNNTVNLELIRSLSGEYNVSLAAMTRKIATVSDECFICLYYYNNGSVFIQAQTSNFKSKYLYSWLINKDKTEIELIEESIPQYNLNRKLILLRKKNDSNWFNELFE